MIRRQTACVKRLLAKAAYTEHWLTFWNDLLRNDYQYGYIDGGRKQRAWLWSRCSRTNPTINSSASESAMPAPKDCQRYQMLRRINASQTTEIQFSKMCRRSFRHQHEAPVPHSFIDTEANDAYGLRHQCSCRDLSLRQTDGQMASPRSMARARRDDGLPRSKTPRAVGRLVTHQENGRFARTIVNRVWERLMGRGIVHPVDVMANKPWNEDLLDYLAVYLVDHQYDLKQLLEHIISSRTYQSRNVPQATENVGDDYVFRGPELKRMTAEEFLDAIWMITGTGPTKVIGAVKRTEPDPTAPEERKFIRASLVQANLLMRSLGRPNREQVVTTRPSQLSTLQALDLANGQVL